ncbi:immunoglobulin superfamily member 3-like [Pelodytes ibericus]
MPPGSCWLLLLGILGLCRAQREVEVQEGPLYRTIGTHISIWCKVRGYQGPSQQDFRWSIYLPSAPDREVQVVSTDDSSFSYAIYSPRVRSGDIYVERLSGDHALLHIRQLQERDSGEYECHTPNTDPSYHGSYSAKMNLSVVADTLEVKMPLQTLTFTEGASLELTCQVSKTSSQHTHLSVAWLLTPDTEILTLTRDFILKPGPAYSVRFTSGEVRLDKLGETAYRLAIQGLRVSDQGNISCRASEWIQDPDKTWADIVTRASEQSTVEVSAVKGRDFEVKVLSSVSLLPAGKPLEMICSVIGQDVANRKFHVKWLLNDAVLGTWHPSGVTTFLGQYEDRAARARVMMGRQSQDSWYLRVCPARGEDRGSYVCEVSEEQSEGPGTRRSRLSNILSVTVTETVSDPQVTLHSDPAQVYEGESVRFLCQVAEFSGTVSVAWWVTGPLSARLVAGLQRDGQLSMGGAYLQRHAHGQLVAEKLGAGKFTLTLASLQMEDSARYMCQATVWSLDPDGSWSNTSSKAGNSQLEVMPLGKWASAWCNAETLQIAHHAGLALHSHVMHCLVTQAPAGHCPRVQINRADLCGVNRADLIQ